MANTRTTTSSTSRKPRTPRVVARQAAEPETDGREVGAAEAQEIEAEEGHYVTAELAGAEGQQIFGGELSDEGIGLQAVSEGHGESVARKIGRAHV